uniref:TNase-like domain-containing protein n=1 Tax=viral metagenome TaxID=1070528 RepID=A0A6C0AC91_9ZZZZ
MFKTNREINKLKKIQEADKRTFSNTTRLAKVVDVYDGDTLTIFTRLSNKENFYRYKLRLAGLDTPEMKPALDIENRELYLRCAEKARDWLKKYLGHYLIVKFYKEDKYGRLVGELFTIKKNWYGKKVPYMNINKKILELKLAIPYPRDNHSFTKEFLDSLDSRF